MDKRSFLKASGACIVGGMLSRLTASEQKSGALTNWSGNYTYSTDRVHYPTTVEEVQHLVKSCDRVKALGSRHSFDAIADTTGDQISLKQMQRMVIDRKTSTVTVDAGVKYGLLSPYLDQNGYALHNLASLPHISVAGACATATHGSGDKNGNLSTAVAGMEVVKANGELVTLSREHDGEHFEGAVVALGGMGVATKVTLKLQPTFRMSQVVYENLPLGELEHHFDEIFGSGYSVSLFTDWQNHRATQVWIKSRIESIRTEAGQTTPAKPEFFGAKLATRKLHPLAGHSAENCTDQMGIPGPWYERMPHFRMNFTPSSGAELQSEYFVPREKAYQAILAVEKLRDHVTPHLFITEFRTIHQDSLWMSPCFQRNCMTIHFTWKPEWPAVKQVLPMIEEQLAPFDARPHWAKLFTMAPAQLKSRYVKLPEFQALLKQYDPIGKFANRFLMQNVCS
jgi:xylitol oxidase